MISEVNSSLNTRISNLTIIARLSPLLTMVKIFYTNDRLAGFRYSQSPFFVKCLRKMAECKHTGQAARPHTIGAYRSNRSSCAAQTGLNPLDRPADPWGGPHQTTQAAKTHIQSSWTSVLKHSKGNLLNHEIQKKTCCI